MIFDNPYNHTLASAVFAGILGLLFLGIGVVIYGRTGGKELAERLGVPRPAIIAHRGASDFAPEETAPTYLLAREMAVYYLELDLQRTKDGVPIAVHDDDLRRTTNIAEVFPGREMDTVDKFTFADLQSLDAGSWFNIRFPDRARAFFKKARMLRLEDVINIAGREKGSGVFYFRFDRPRECRVASRPSFLAMLILHSSLTKGRPRCALDRRSSNSDTLSGWLIHSIQ